MLRLSICIRPKQKKIIQRRVDRLHCHEHYSNIQLHVGSWLFVYDFILILLWLKLFPASRAISLIQQHHKVTFSKKEKLSKTRSCNVNARVVFMATLAWAYFQSMQQESQNFAIGRSYASCIESVSLIKQSYAVEKHCRGRGSLLETLRFCC